MSRILKTAYLSGSQVVTTLSTLIIAAVLSRVLESKADYGTYQQTLLVYTFLAPLLALGLPAASFYFCSKSGSNHRLIFYNALILIFMVSLVFGIFCMTIGKSYIPNLFNNADLEQTIPWLAIYGPATLLILYASSFLVAIDYAKISAILTILFRVFLATSVILVLLFSSRLELIISVQSYVILFGALIGIFLVYRYSNNKEKTRSSISIKNINDQLKYAVPLGLGAMLEGMALAIDRLMVSALLEPEEYAVFVNGAMEIPFISAITIAAGAVILPEIVKAFENKNSSEALDLWQLMVRRVTIILLPAGLLFYLISQELMIILYSDKFKESVEPFRIYMLMLPARVAYFGMLFQAAGKTRLVLYRAIITLSLNTIITYFLVRKFGMAGAAWGTVAVVWLFVVPYCVLVCSKITNVRWYKLLPYRYIFSVGIVSFSVALIVWLISSMFGFQNVFITTFLKGSAYCALVVASMFLFFRNDCIHIYKQLMSKIIKN